MSRISDIQGILRGLGKIGNHSCRQCGKDFSNIYSNIYIQPVINQAIRIVLDIKDPVVNSQSRAKGAKRPSQVGLDMSQVVQNIPLVVQGMGVFTSLIITGNTNNLLKLSQKPNLVNNEELSDNRTLNVDISAIDLLEFDLTNEDLLKSKIFKSVNPTESNPSNKTVKFDKSEASIPVTDEQDLTKEIEDPRHVNKLKTDARERSVPSSRISRVANFASLGVGLGLGIVAEASRRAVGVRPNHSSGAKLDGSIVLNEANAERIVSTLCRVRGAALKLGQMLSIQDGAVVGPELQRIFDRVRESADFMPEWQLERVLSGELGQDWRDKYREFSVRPFAAASIGEVHYAELHDGTPVAVKVQYPGVAKSIDSDIRNLISLVSMLAILPKGLFLDNIARHMKTELAEECDYVREAECGVRMRRILSQYPEYYVPIVYPELSTGQVLTTELITGLTIDKCVELDQDTRNFIAKSILKLVFRELFLHRYMQTDPNWANFLYNPRTGKIGLLDFGATREYRPGFVNTYFKIIDAAARKDRDSVLKYSRELGFLTGYESQAMNDAHIDSVMLLAVPFHENKPFNFGQQRITHDIQDKTAVMLKERLCPPPQEVYSLHRKLSGLFLLAGKLDAQFNCYVIWQEIRNQFKPFQEEN